MKNARKSTVFDPEYSLSTRIARLHAPDNRLKNTKIGAKIPETVAHCCTTQSPASPIRKNAGAESRPGVFLYHSFGVEKMS